MFALFRKFDVRTYTQDLSPFLISETGLKFLIWTLGKIHQVTKRQPGSYEEALKLTKASTLSIWKEEIQVKSLEWTTQTAIHCDTFWLT